MRTASPEHPVTPPRPLAPRPVVGRHQMGPASAPDAVRHKNPKSEANLSVRRLYLRSQAWQPSCLSLSDAFEQLSAHVSAITRVQLPQPFGFGGVALRGHFQRGELSAGSPQTIACPTGLLPHVQPGPGGCQVLPPSPSILGCASCTKPLLLDKAKPEV